MTGFIAVLDYGIGNLRSAEKALVAVGADARLVTSVEQAEGASAVVLPGVGAFGACMDALRDSKLDQVVYSAIDRGLPFLGICVGLQMLYEGSEESPGVDGLGICKGRIELMRTSLKLPQMQWNRLDLLPTVPGESESRASTTNELFDGISEPWMYFVHSYAAPVDEYTIATCDYGGAVTAVINKGNLWATQFHPEKSSKSGLDLLTNFVALTKRLSSGTAE